MVSEFKRDMAAVQLLVELANEYAISTEDCLADTGLNIADLGNPQAEIKVAQELAVIRHIQNQLGSDIGLGIIVGLRHRLSMRGILSFTALSSASVREAVDLILQHMDLNSSYCSIVLEKGERESLLQFDTQMPADVSRFLIERTVGAAIAYCQELTGSPKPMNRLELAFTNPVYAELLECLAPQQLILGAEHHCLVIDNAMMDLPLPTANALTQRLCLELCQKLLNARNIRSGVAEVVRDLLLQEPANMLSIEKLAIHLNIAVRTLRRQLENENTSYRELVNEIRIALANELLHTGMSIEFVAERLGFAEASSFIRAYKRLTGLTPGKSIQRSIVA